MTTQRKNSHGGARPGAGRPRRVQPKPIPVSGNPDMLSLLEAVARGEVKITSIQLRAAIAAIPYTHARADTGKKEERQKAASAALLRFPKPIPPKTR